MLAVAALALAPAMLLAACGGATGPAHGTSSAHAPSRAELIRRGAVPRSAPLLGGTVQIAYRNIAIDPDVLRVKLGSAIRWTNYDAVDHNVTSTGGPLHFASGNFGEGRSFQIKATKPGLITYESTLQPTTMNGTIEVVP